MWRFLTILLISAWAALAPAAPGMAQSTGRSPPQLQLLRQQNPLIDEVARADSDRLWGLLSKLQSLISTPGAPARTGTPPTADEAAQITRNPAFDQAYKSDPGGTLALLRATNDALRRARKGADLEYPSRVALVVGDNGGGAWGRLSNADNDARLISANLRALGFTLVTGDALIDPDRTQLREAIRQFARTIGKNTVALFYFAGHGIQYHEHSYLVPAHAAVPSTEDDFDRLLVEVDDTILQRLQEAEGRLSIIVLDACRNLPPPVPLPSRIATRGGPSTGMAEPRVPAGMRGVVFFYSTGPGTVARDKVHDGDVNGPFARAFSDAIMKPGVELQDVFDAVKQEVKRVTMGTQRPWVTSDATGKFFLSDSLDSMKSKRQPASQAADFANYPLQPFPRSQNKRCDTWAGETFCE